MKQRVAIIDYGSENLRSATKAFERAVSEAGLDASIELTNDAETVRQADKIVLPGVGAYADCRAGLDAVTGMVDVLNERVLQGSCDSLEACLSNMVRVNSVVIFYMKCDAGSLGKCLKKLTHKLGIKSSNFFPRKLHIPNQKRTS